MLATKTPDLRAVNQDKKNIVFSGTCGPFQSTYREALAEHRGARRRHLRARPQQPAPLPRLQDQGPLPWPPHQGARRRHRRAGLSRRHPSLGRSARDISLGRSTGDLSLGSFATAQDTMDPIAPVQDLGHHPNAR
jgi:hypothetical protein